VDDAVSSDRPLERLTRRPSNTTRTKCSSCLSDYFLQCDAFQKPHAVHFRDTTSMPAIHAFSEHSARDVGNATLPVPLQVVCAFPVSGQYGAGSRIVSPQS
jgi:hypothetical protein